MTGIVAAALVSALRAGRNAGLGAAIGAGAGLAGGPVVNKVGTDREAAYRHGCAAGQVT